MSKWKDETVRAGRAALEAHAMLEYGASDDWDSDENVIDTLTDIAHAVGMQRWEELLVTVQMHVLEELRHDSNIEDIMRLLSPMPI